MTQPVPGPPTSGPPPGWYPDPYGQPGYRWWNGVAWTDDRSEGSDADDAVASVGDLLGETFRVLGQRLGHLFTLAVLLLVPAGVLSSVATYAAFDGVLYEDGTWTGSSSGRIIGAAVTSGLFLLAYTAYSSAVSRQALSSLLGEPEPWSSSAVGGLRRTPRVLGAGLVVWGAAVAAVVLLGVAASALGPVVAVIAVAAVPIVLGVVWVRATLVLPAAAAGPRPPGAIRSSLVMTRGRSWPILGRLLVLAVLWVAVQLGSSIVTAPIAGLAGEAPADAVVVDEDTGELERLDLDALIPDNAGVIGFTAVASALLVAAARAVTVVGRTSLYRSLGGGADEALGEGED